MSIPAAFDYHVAKTVDEAVALLQQYGDEAKVLAGGHSLIPTMKLRLAQPGHLVDIGRIHALAHIHEDNGAISVGPMTTYTMIERSRLLHHHFPMLPEGASLIADQQVRNRGTIGGSLAHSDPASDMPGMVLALKADILAHGPHTKRTIKADDFFTGTFTTALHPNEIITEIRFAFLPARTGTHYEKLANKASHYAVAGCAAVISLGADDVFPEHRGLRGSREPASAPLDAYRRDYPRHPPGGAGSLGCNVRRNRQGHSQQDD